MPYWRLFYHLVWSTRDRAPLITEREEEVIAGSIRATSRELDMRIHAIGLMPDHVHLAVSIPPRWAIAQVVGRLKGASSHAVNAIGSKNDNAFAWQAEYGALSFGERALADVVAYVTNQKTRHAISDLWFGVEQIEGPK